MNKNIKSFLKENKNIFASGIIAAFIISIVYVCYQIIPFGDNIIYRMDLYHQYGPLFSELYDRLTSHGSFMYSWNTGLGSSFFGNYFNYLSSPISFIILLFGHKNTFEAVETMIAIKVILSSIAMTYYLTKSQKNKSFLTTAFGVLYGFSGYFIAYYWNVMWIDAMYLLPFIALGIENIINKGKCKTYVIALSLAIISNYYIAYMICIFSIVYFIYYFICSYDEIRKSTLYLFKKEIENNSKISNRILSKIKNSVFLHSGIKFTLASLGVALSLTFILIPLANILNTCSATGGSAPVEPKLYFNVFDFLANHLASLEPTIRSSGSDVLPNIYCGIITIMLLPFYFFSKRIKSSEKIASSVLLIFMYFSFNVNYLNYVWHGLHFPNDLPYRQSFMYSFIIIVLAFKAITNIKDFEKKHIITVGMALMFFIAIAQKVGSKNVNDDTVIISMVAIFAYMIILGLMISKKSQAFALSITLLCTVSAEIILGSTDHYVANQSKTSFASDYDKFKEIQSDIKKEEKDLFYREELSKLRARMDSSWYNYNGTSTFSSMAYESVAVLQKDIGVYGNNINSFTYNPQTPVYNAMFSLKYIYDKDNLIHNGQYYEMKTSNEKFNAFENKYNLSVAFPASNNLINWNGNDFDNPVTAQEKMFEYATGIENVFNRIYDYDIIVGNIINILNENKYSESLQLTRVSKEYDASATVQYIAKNSDNIYVYINSRNLDKVTITSSILNTTMNVNDGYILDLGSYNEGDLISIELPLKAKNSSATVDFTLFTVNNERFIEGFNRLKDGELNITDFNDTTIKGSFNAENDEIIYTSIPYDKGWTIYIDDKLVPEDDIVKISDALMGIKTSMGNHTITLKYETPYLYYSFIFSLIFIIFILVTMFMRKFVIKKRKDNLWDKISVVKDKINNNHKFSDEIIIFDDDINFNDEINNDDNIE